MRQHDEIIEYCKTHDGITMDDGFRDLHITKVNSRIGELERKGYTFSRTWEKSDTARWIRYRLVSEPVEFKAVGHQLVFA